MCGVLNVCDMRCLSKLHASAAILKSTIVNSY
jgi:hypothetical protein